MILVDLNQVLISNLMAQVRGKADVKPNKEMITSYGIELVKRVSMLSLKTSMVIWFLFRR